MLRKKSHYYYDPESCTYVPVKNTAPVVLRKLALAVAFVGIVVGGTKFGFEHFFVGFQEGNQVQAQQALLSDLEQVNERLARYEEQLTDYYEKSNSFYRPTVGEAQISQSYWNGGRGGTPRYNRSNHTQLNLTQLRFERVTHQVGLLARSYDDIKVKAAKKEMEMRNLPSIMPVNGGLISGFGVRTHPVSGRQKLHEGVDFACGIGTPIYSPGNGVVEATGYIGNGYGINVNLDHENGYKTKFAHMSESVVTDGQRVKRGQLLGYSGNTGLSTGPHLHYEIMLNGEKIDPIDFFYQDLSPNEYRSLKLNKAEASKEALKEKLSTLPAMD